MSAGGRETSGFKALALLSDKAVRIAIMLVLLAGIASTSWAALIGAGSISYDNGLYAYGDHWAQNASVLNWKVSKTGSTYIYHYTFKVEGHARNITQVILETSTNFTAADILSGTTRPGQVGAWTVNHPRAVNPRVPTTLYGIEWDITGKSPYTSFSWTIVTDQAPGWGTFYAKGGNGLGIYAYSGTAGHLADRVLVPDGRGSIFIPLPAAALLFGPALTGLVLLRRRFGIWPLSFND